MKKRWDNEIIAYLFFGVLTTIIYFCLRFLIVYWTSNSLLAVCIAQFGAIVFAFITNKFLVFKKKSTVRMMDQFIQFTLGRLLVLSLDLGITYIGVTKYPSFFIGIFSLNQIDYTYSFFYFPVLKNFIGSPKLLNEFLFALGVQIMAIVLNYLISKKRVFKN